MKYIKSFKIFESNESDNFVITKDTPLDDFTSYLEKQLDSHSDYGNGMTFENEIKRVIENTLKSEGMSEEEIEGKIEEFSRNLSEDTDMISNEYDEYDTSFEGTNSYKDKVVFEWSAGGDLYGFGGTLKDLSELLEDIKSLLEYFINENYSLDEKSKKTIDEYYNEIMEKPLSKIFFRGYFDATSSFKTNQHDGGKLFERLFTIYEDLMESDEGKTILKKYLKTLLLIELRLDKMATNAIEKKTGKRDKKSERGNQTVRSGLKTNWGGDKYSLAMKIYPQEIESNLKNFKNIVDKMTTESIRLFDDSYREFENRPKK